MKPNLYNRIFHYKSAKLLYFLHNLVRYYTPRTLLQRQLPALLEEAMQRPDRDEILRRVDYYNRLPQFDTVPEGLRPLAEHRLGSIQSAYFFDSYEFTRFFDDRLRWAIEPGDVTEVPAVPSILKSRPVAGNLSNSVLLNLDKHRHFLFLRDDIPFRAKANRAIFRANINHRHPNHVVRLRFVERYFGSEICDVGVSNRSPVVREEWLSPPRRVSEYDHLVYKFIICLEGNDVATNLKWVMSTNSLAVMPRPRYETWYMEGSLVPNYHYVEIRPDYADLEERLQYYIDRPEEAEAIIAHAHEWQQQFADPRRERLISLLVLQRYFERTGQL